MIGVAANAADLEIAEEFFELFKTPWEPAVPGRRYRVALGSGRTVENIDADVVLLFGSSEQSEDRQRGIRVRRVTAPAEIEFEGSRFPVYGDTALFEGGNGSLKSDGKSVDRCERSEQRTVWRIGYDLFGETRHLLTKGQPVRYAQTPTLEFHIAVLRYLLNQSAVSYAEVPPRPSGYDFICCLTHDLDFFGIRRHRLDATLVGFIARASVGTFVDCLRGRRPLADVLRNWLSLGSLPFVFLGVTPDFWSPIEDYGRVERERRSTFFVIPFKDRAGIGPDDAVNPRRAVRYQASEVDRALSTAAARGNEISLHGIDAWRDVSNGLAEMAEITKITRRSSAGVRMHWLYFSEDSPRQLEAAGFDYDSTWGYNDAVGYRPGTSQAFRLPGTRNLMELPLTIMDTALLFPDRMSLSREEALQRCFQIVANARRFGGTVVVNWHDRSLVPERLWGATYESLLQGLSTDGRAWFATAGEAVGWFKWRRSIRFRSESSNRVTVAAGARDSALPPATLRIHRACGKSPSPAQEICLTGAEPVTLQL